MDAQTFIANFGQIISAPGGTSRLREMILQLAVSSDLTVQEASDTPASETYERIQSVKQKLISEETIPKQPALGPVADSEIPWELPKNWLWCRLGDVTTYGTTDKAEFQDATEKTWVLELEDIEKETSRVIEKVRAKNRQFRSTKNKFSKGDVLYGKLRPYLDKVVLADEDGVCTTEIIPVSIYCGIVPEYLRWHLKSPFFRNYAQSSTHGMNLPRMGTDAGRNALFALPPEKEQQRIVAKVDELMALCDRLETQQQERQKLFPVLSQASHDSFTGAPNAANFDRIFDKLGTVSADDLRKTIRTLAIDGKLFETRIGQSSWPKLKLKDVCSLITDGEHATPQRTSSGIPLATAKNIRDGFLNLTNTDWVSVETAKKCWRRCKPQNDDVLMVCVGATIGRLCLVQNPPDMVLVRSVALLRPNIEIITPAYLDHFLRSPLGQKQIWAGVKQNAQPCLYLGRMNEFELLVPPLADQRKIVAKVDQLMALIDTLEKQQQERDHLAETFAKAVVASLTGTQIAERKEKMKAPKTELISNLQLGTKPKAKDDAPLATLLIKAKGELSAKSLWQQSGLTIDAFYQQLKTELARGWIAPPKEAEMKTIEEETPAKSYRREPNPDDRRIEPDL